MSEKKSFFNFTFFITCIICILPVVFGFFLWDKLPEHIPQQYGFNDEPTWTLAKPWGFILCPLILLILNIIINVIAYKNPEQNKKVFATIIWVIPVLSLIINSFMILKPAGLDLTPTQFLLPVISMMFIIIGNYLPKTQANSVIGIRAPWINSNPDVWQKTNRLGGILFVTGGLISLITSFTPVGKYVFASVILCICVILFVYSIVLARKKENK
ncbi:MAG: SdpI family protein [Treponema sp.]|uniref:SdpI family protein n=1 Tax=Treponema sp. TaxID=166 RepID=UPI00298DD503|nr:SdpI family protein [Treponema sp.]MCR5387056.1 SdpI family protein [Treponema sp.]